MKLTIRHGMRIWAGTARLPFLLLAPLCVAVSVAYLHYQQESLVWFEVSLCLSAAILAHASVNMLNEYHDYQSGLDALTTRTPFSGGSGTLQQYPASAHWVKTLAYACLTVVMLIGLYFVMNRGLTLVILGLIGLACVLFYTPDINQRPWICLIAPGTGFAVVITVGSFAALSGRVEYGILLLCAPAFFLINNLLLLNQYPDKKADEQAGRRHLLIVYGEQAGQWVYMGNMMLAVLSTVFLVWHFALTEWVWLFLVPFCAAGFSVTGLLRYIKNHNLKQLHPYLASNVLATLTYPVVVSVLLVIA